MNKVKSVANKSISPYFNIQLLKSFSGRLTWFWALKIDSEHSKYPIFEDHNQKVLQKSFEDLHSNLNLYGIQPK